MRQHLFDCSILNSLLQDCCSKINVCLAYYRWPFQSLLSMPSIKEKENKKLGEEILALLSQPTAKEKSLAERFRSQGGAQVMEFCPHGTRGECAKMGQETCKKLHFKKIIQKHTDETLGDCSFLNTCFHMDSCK